MLARPFVVTVVALALVVGSITAGIACCSVARPGQYVVNADQTVLIVWDEKNKRQHFIRQATFRSADSQIGFLIPSPNIPELAESGNDAFPLLAKFTEPKIVRRSAGGGGCACGAPMAPGAATRVDSAAKVTVLHEQRVAGFDAKVLEADTADALTEWLKENEFDYTDAVKEWARPYVEQKWKFTALKIAKDDGTEGEAKSLAAAALRMSFETDRPLFPYREPDSAASAEKLKIADRMLRIFVLAPYRAQGKFETSDRWTGNVAWAGQLETAQQNNLFEKLKLTEQQPDEPMWLTEFEDHWPYKQAPSDLYFSKAEVQADVRRPDVIEYVRTGSSGDFAVFALAGCLAVPYLLRRRK